MVTQFNVVDEEEQSDSQSDSQVINNILNVDKVADDNPKLGLALRVSNALQTTLDMEQLIGLFSQQISPALPHDSISYQNDAHGIIIAAKGRKKKYSCNYRILLNGKLLGEVSLHRNWEFGLEEGKVFEYTLCSLVYPLRNAILYQEALHAAHKDPLTGVNNRATLDETLVRETRLARRYERPLSIIVLDIDHFKVVNDTLGHAAGDCVIRATAERTASCIRSTDMLFRYGGEEFVILLSNTNSKGASYLAGRIRKAIERTQTHCNGTPAKVTVSLGVATLLSEENENDFFTRADSALYRAKNEGRNCVRIAEFAKKTKSQEDSD